MVVKGGGYGMVAGAGTGAGAAVAGEVLSVITGLPSV